MENQITIHLTPHSKWKWASMLWSAIIGLIVAGAIGLFGYFTYLAFESHVMLGIVVAAFMVLMLMWLKKVIEISYFREKIIVNTDSITVVITSPVGTKKRKVALKDIEYFGEVSADSFSDPYTPTVITYVYDTSGVNTYHVRDNLIEEGRMEIRTSQKKIRFGRNMVSWDIDDIVRQVELHAGVFFKRF